MTPPTQQSSDDGGSDNSSVVNNNNNHNNHNNHNYYAVEWTSINRNKFVGILGLSTLVENVCIYPLLLLKTRQQIDKSPKFALLKGNFSQLSSIIKIEGIQGIYRGFWTYSLIALPKCTYFLTYQWSKNYYYSKSFEERNYFEKTLKFASPLLAGLSAEFAANFFFVPIELITQRLQVRPLLPNTSPSYHLNAPQMVVKLWKEEGIVGFYRGYGATMLTFGISSSVYWMTYEYSKTLITSLSQSIRKQFVSYISKHFQKNYFDLSHQHYHLHHHHHYYHFNERNPQIHPPNDGDDDDKKRMGKVSRPIQFLSGFLAGVASSVISNPFDIVKTRLQTDQSKEYKNSFHGLRLLYLHDGLKGFTRGLLAKSIRTGPFAAAYSLLYEQVLTWSMLPA